MFNDDKINLFQCLLRNLKGSLLTDLVSLLHVGNSGAMQVVRNVSHEFVAAVLRAVRSNVVTMKLKWQSLQRPGFLVACVSMSVWSVFRLVVATYLNIFS